MKKRSVISLLILIIVLFITGIILNRTFSIRGKAVTTGWQTYQNEKYKYRIKYPGNWYVDKRGGDEDWIRTPGSSDLVGGMVVFWNKPDYAHFLTPNDYPDDYALISLFPLGVGKGKISLKNWIKERMGVRWLISRRTISGVNLKGYQVKFRDRDVAGKGFVKTYFLCPGVVYILSYSHGGAMPEKEVRKIYEGMLSTFEFLK